MNPPAQKIARVYIQLKTRSLARPLDYLVPPALNGRLKVGGVVLVSLGRQKALGVVAALGGDTDVPRENLVDIETVLDYPSIPEPLIRLALRVSEYYYCPPASALGLVLPPGGLPALTRTRTGGKTHYQLRPPRVKPRRVRFARLPAATPAGEVREDAPRYRRTAARGRLLSLLADGEEMPVPDVLRRAGVGRATLGSLAGLGLVEIVDREVSRNGMRYYGEGSGGGKRLPPELNRAQERAFRAIVSRLAETEAPRRSRPILVQGVPGAGKTEIYLRAIEAAAARGRTAIVLVPEISLTHQAVKRFRRRFGERVGVLHSGLGLGERYDEYRRIREGGVTVVIGPRSALFAPIPNLGLIVIDEENDGSFKQENDPRYDARRVAQMRAGLEGAALVLGSATPSLESYHQVRDRFILPERATGAPLPPVEIVDMRREADQLFSRRLLEELNRNAAANGKSILMLNSRGYARFLQCAACGHVFKCGNCDVSLTIHHGAGRLLCHHCGYARAMPDICPECGSAELRRWGVGTEQLERETARLFPEAPVFRLDTDTARSYGAAPQILEQFGASEGGILVGTQMVAKGHHFPDVTLAAVINADLALQFPEFRAEEHTLALLLQLAGRSGRDRRPGRVLIQTWNGDIECIRMAAGHRLDEFYRRELVRRRRLGYPPFASLVNVVFLARDEGRDRKAALSLKERLGPVLDDASLLGPAPLFRVKGWWRSHLLIKTGGVEATLAAITPVLEKYRQPYRSRGVRIVVDVDPQWLS